MYRCAINYFVLLSREVFPNHFPRNLTNGVSQVSVVNCKIDCTVIPTENNSYIYSSKRAREPTVRLKDTTDENKHQTC